MKRRGFFGLMGGAVVAGPSMAKAAVTQVAETMSVSGVGLSGAYGGGGFGPTPERGEVAGELLNLRSHLSRLAMKSADELARERRMISVHSLDPDLAAMRSMSLDYRMKKQRDRNFERQRDEERGWIERRISDLLSA